MLDRLLLVAVVLAGCGRDLAIASDTTLSGTHLARNVFVASGTTVTVIGDFSIEASGRIVIDGVVRAQDESGADISLVAQSGDIEINGEVTAGSGRNATALAGSGMVIVTELAGDGGIVTLRATQGSVIVRGDVTGGAGGNGGNATAAGPGPVQRAESGAGGSGGHVLISASRDIDIGLGGAGELTAGPGGDGGEADASITADVDVDAPPQGQALGTSGSGGNGGDVRLTLTTATGTLLVQGSVNGGNAGATRMAVAAGGEAEAITRKAGRGGDVLFSAPNETQIMPPLVEATPGDGGDNGVPAGPDQAFAVAFVRALARVGAGGDPGLVLRGATELDAGTGGSNGNGQVRIAGTPTASPGRIAIDRSPAPEHEVLRP
jgi:hypothetical protein